MQDQGWVALTAARIVERGPAWKPVNGSISRLGKAGRAERIVPALEGDQPAAVVIALGANDGLRKLPMQELRANGAQMFGAAQETGAHILLVGMTISPDWGTEYANAFNEGYALMAECLDVTLPSSLLELNVNDRDASRADDLHPAAKAHPTIRDQIFQLLASLLDQRAARRRSV